jgi:hypothetical protein
LQPSFGVTFQIATNQKTSREMSSENKHTKSPQLHTAQLIHGCDVREPQGKINSLNHAPDIMSNYRTSPYENQKSY